MKMRPASLPVILIAVFCLHSIAYAASTLEITHPWVREAPPSARVLAAYMSIKNPGDSAITINGISSPDFESAEIHRTVINDGVARMLHIKQLDVPANGIIRLEPGGLHLMLFNPKRMLAEGDTITLTIHLGNETCMTVSTPVVRQDDDHSRHHH
ncbi:MAG: copper chaperone PCu(A)C [Gammaproteobacteria bacterium]|nr:copper chaperone PCu(A)C [Gammaproteobacteria bacterium]